MGAAGRSDPEGQQPLWRALEAAAAAGGRATGGAAARDWAAAGVSIDTRTLAPGDLFVALRGEAADGHAYVRRAFEAGAVAALVAARPADLGDDAPLIEVADPLTALTDLGRAARARARDLRAIAVTGSVGKTSTKDMLGAMLADQGRTHAAAKSYNNHIGVPLTLARTPASARFGVYEIGMSAPGEIAPLARLVRPQAAIVTAVAPVHTEAFADGVDGVAREKASIFEGLGAGGVAVIDRGSPHFELLQAAARAVGAEIREFGLGARHAELCDVVVGEASTVVAARLFGREFRIEIGAPGRHFAMNALAALAASAAVGADLDRAARSLAGWRALDGRGARRRLAFADGEILLVDESYNANPASMAAAIETFAAVARPKTAAGGEGRRVAFLTDMLELGRAAEAHHAALADTPGAEAIDVVHCAGPLMAALHAALPADRRGRWFAEPDAMAAAACGLVRAGDAVLVKGSLGSRAARVAAALVAGGRPATEASAGAALG